MKDTPETISGVHLIAAVGRSGQIGLGGKIPWHGIPELAAHTRRDLSHFARMSNDGILIMGSVTAQNLPKNFDPGSRVIYTWSRRDWGSPQAMLTALRSMYPQNNIWICGGQKVYELFMPYVECHHITVIPYDGPADRFMPPILPVYGTVPVVLQERLMQDDVLVQSTAISVFKINPIVPDRKVALVILRPDGPMTIWHGWLVDMPKSLFDRADEAHVSDWTYRRVAEKAAETGKGILLQ